MFLFDRILSVIAPHECIGCEAEGSLLCGWCRTDLLQPIPDRCYRCQALSTDFKVCSKCRSHSGLRHVWIVTSYENAAKQLIHKLKFERAAAAAEPIAATMLERLPYVASRTLVTHVPTASARVRQRGYDQADLIAQRIAHDKKLTYAPLLGRLGQVRQVGANRKQRREQLKSSFYERNRKLITNADILLVDDIVTTGATLEAAAKALRQAGAKSVSAVVFAQKQ